MESAGDFHQGCGVCCERIGRPPFVPKLRSGRLSEDGFALDYDFADGTPEELVEEVREYALAVCRGRIPERGVQNLPCFWYDEASRQCRHYPWRPPACREHDCGGRSRRR
jgi:Fe-S-cluster containining protein